MFQILLVGMLLLQNVGGSIQGVVIDPSGAAVPGVNVVIRNVATGDTRELVTDAAGRYLVPVLPPGEYEVRAALQGFQTVRAARHHAARRAGAR